MVNLVLIVECSKHIIPYRQLYIDTINKFIQAIKTINDEIALTIAFYNTKSTLYCLNKPVKDITSVSEDDFKPANKACYYDSAIQIGNKLERMYRINSQPMPLVFILCNTGDEESNSQDRLSALQIALQKRRGWGFIFSGGSDNAIKLAQRLNYQFIYRYHNTTYSLNQFVEQSKKTLTDALLSKYMSKLNMESS